MFEFILVVIFVWIIGALVRSRATKDQPSGTISPTALRDATSGKQARKFATEVVGNNYLPRSRQEVDAMFAPTSEFLRRIEDAAKSAGRKSDEFHEAAMRGRPIEVDLSPELRLADLAAEINKDFEEKYDRLYFVRDGSEDRYFKIIEKIDDAESEIRGAAESIDWTRSDLKDGETIDGFVDSRGVYRTLDRPKKKSGAKSKARPKSKRKPETMDLETLKRRQALYGRQLHGQPQFSIEYQDGDGVITERTITPTSILPAEEIGEVYIQAYCSLRGDSRTFRNSRIMNCRNLQNGRTVDDLGSLLIAAAPNA